MDNTHLCIKIRCLRDDQRKALYIFWAEKQWHCAPCTCVSFIVVRSVAVLYWRTARNYLIRNPFEDASTSVQIFHSPFSASLISVQFTVNGRMIENNFDVHKIGFARNCWLIKPSHPWAWKSHLGQKHSWDNLRSILFAKQKRGNTRQWQKLTRRTNFIYILECRHIFHWTVVLKALILILIFLVESVLMAGEGELV